MTRREWPRTWIHEHYDPAAARARLAGETQYLEPQLYRPKPPVYDPRRDLPPERMRLAKPLPAWQAFILYYLAAIAVVAVMLTWFSLGR